MIPFAQIPQAAAACGIFLSVAVGVFAACSLPSESMVADVPRW